MHSTEAALAGPGVNDTRRASAGGRRAIRPVRPPRYDSWRGVLWTIVIALDFFWMSNPVVYRRFDVSLRDACIVTGVAVVLTLPQVRAPRPAWSVLAVVGLGFSSVLWSTYPDVSFAFTLYAVMVAVLATVVVACADARTVAHGLTLGGVVVLAISVYAAVTDMPKARMPDGAAGYLAGVSGNRNILAYTLLLSLALAVSFIPSRWWGRVLWSLGTGAVLVGIYLARSGTGMVAAVLVLGCAGTLMLFDRNRPAGGVNGARRRWSVLALAVGLPLAGVLIVGLIARLLGRDIATLSGRVQLWKSIWHSTTGRDRWIGDGWGAVWPHSWEPAPQTNSDFVEITTNTGIWLSHGHSAIFDLIPELGVVGVAVFALTYVEAISRSLRWRNPSRPASPAELQAARAGILGILALVLCGLTEPMSTVPLGWFVTVVLASGLRPASPNRRRVRVRGGRRASTATRGAAR